MTLEQRMDALAQEIVSRELGGESYVQHLAVVSDAAQRISDLEKRCAMLQEKLWSVLKEQRDITDLAAGRAKQELEWAVSQGLHRHLPTVEEVQADGPYVLMR